jgi:hypothetical protein
MILDPPKHAAITNDWGQTWQSASANLATACHHLISCAFPIDLACGSARFCLALPSADPNGALVWNGVKWGFATLASVRGHLPKLTALACGSARNCIATGTYQVNPRATPAPIAERWTGKAWTVTPIAKP